MPLPMVHLLVAELVKDRCRPMTFDEPGYYLGCLAPDGAHHRANYDYRVDRKRAHLEAEDPARWLANVDALLAAKAGDADYCFYIGYAVHILTDIHWENTLSARFHERYSRLESTTFPNERKAYTAEMTRIDMVLYRKEGMREKLWDTLRQGRAPDFVPYVSAREAEREKELTLSWYEDESHWPAQYPGLVHREEVMGFVEDAAAQIGERLTAYGFWP